MEKCALPYCTEVHAGNLYFCLKHGKEWIVSDQRKSVDWTCNASYDKQAKLFVEDKLANSIENLVVSPRAVDENSFAEI